MTRHGLDPVSLTVYWAIPDSDVTPLWRNKFAFSTVNM